MNDRINEIRILLLVNHGLYRTSLAKFLASEAGFDVVGECGTSAEALGIIHTSPVDVVLVDFDSVTQQDFIPAARTSGYQGRFLIVAEPSEVEGSAIALKLGASGIFLTSEIADRLVQAIRVVATGAVWIDQKIIRLFADQTAPKSGSMLKDQEQKVLFGILDGLTSKKIADRIGISEGYVKHIVQALFSKAGVRKRSQLVRLALEGSLGDVQWPSKRLRNGLLFMPQSASNLGEK